MVRCQCRTVSKDSVSQLPVVLEKERERERETFVVGGVCVPVCECYLGSEYECMTSTSDLFNRIVHLLELVCTSCSEWRG